MLKTTELTIEDCDIKIAEAYEHLVNEEDTTPDRWTGEINRWLDQRLFLMYGLRTPEEKEINA